MGPDRIKRNGCVSFYYYTYKLETSSAHYISDKIYERLTGETGYFDTRIIYVSETGPKNQRIKKLAIMDQDGASTKYLTLGNELVLTPRFNPSNQMVTYLSYFRNLTKSLSFRY